MLNEFYQILGQTYYGNTIEKYLIFAGILLLGIIFKSLLSRAIGYLIFKIFRKSGREVGLKSFNSLTKKPLKIFLLLIFVYIACDQLAFPGNWNLTPPNEFGIRMIINSTFEILLILSITWLGIKILDFTGLILIKYAEKTESQMDDYLIPFAMDILKILMGVFGLFIIMGSVFQLNIGSLVAGLGIGGLAVALAAKDSLENLFGSFTIFLDKPFFVGDLIKTGEIFGTVEKIGLRSTRIRTLEKSIITIPNKKLTESELDNFSKRELFRTTINIGLVYDTPVEVLKKIISEIDHYINTHPKTNNEGIVRFTEFADSSLNILILFYTVTNNWEEYLSIKEEVNFKLIEIVQNNNSSFAFPTRTVILDK